MQSRRKFSENYLAIFQGNKNFSTTWIDHRLCFLIPLRPSPSPHFCHSAPFSRCESEKAKDHNNFTHMWGIELNTNSSVVTARGEGVVGC